MKSIKGRLIVSIVVVLSVLCLMWGCSSADIVSDNDTGNSGAGSETNQNSQTNDDNNNNDDSTSGNNQNQNTPTTLDTPTNLTLTDNGDGTITATWNTVTNATAYTVVANGESTQTTASSYTFSAIDDTNTFSVSATGDGITTLTSQSATKELTVQIIDENAQKLALYKNFYDAVESKMIERLGSHFYSDSIDLNYLYLDSDNKLCVNLFAKRDNGAEGFFTYRFNKAVLSDISQLDETVLENVNNSTNLTIKDIAPSGTNEYKSEIESVLKRTGTIPQSARVIYAGVNDVNQLSFGSIGNCLVAYEYNGEITQGTYKLEKDNVNMSDFKKHIGSCERSRVVSSTTFDNNSLTMLMRRLEDNGFSQLS